VTHRSRVFLVVLDKFSQIEERIEKSPGLCRKQRQKKTNSKKRNRAPLATETHKQKQGHSLKKKNRKV
jgi:hypothetical protein